jgi:hypothetical protein
MRRSNPSSNEFFDGRHRREHWYRDNSVYFITARCRDKFPAFESEEAKAVFWDRFTHYAAFHGFVPLITTLLWNHYHTVGSMKSAIGLGEMMRKIHGSVAKLVNDLLPERRVPFWGDGEHDDYFDGCLRDELQYRRAFRYTRLQAVSARLVSDWRQYPHTRVNVEMEPALKRALELKAFAEDLPYERYQRLRRWRERGDS